MIPKIRIGKVLNKLGSKKSNAIPSSANKIEVPARVKAFTLAGTSILFALLGIALDFFDPNLFKTLPMRIFGIMNNQTLLAVPLFVFMGVF